MRLATDTKGSRSLSRTDKRKDEFRVFENTFLPTEDFARSLAAKPTLSCIFHRYTNDFVCLHDSARGQHDQGKQHFTSMKRPAFPHRKRCDGI